MEKVFEKYSPLITSVFTLVVYITTMSRGVMPIDAGELAASQYYLGISHPSGYPLFNLIGFLWSKLPIGSVIFRLNLLCAIWVALANFFMVKTAFVFIKNSFRPKPQVKLAGGKKTGVTDPANNISPFLMLIASCSGILILAFIRVWWIQSAGVEVYSLQIALLAAFFFVFIRTWYKNNTKKMDWLWVGILLGLCFTNHLTSVLILPGILVLLIIQLITQLNNKQFSLKNFIPLLIAGTGCIAVILLFYLGVMMNRAGSSPLVNWGNPENFEYLKRHVSGWQFKVFMEQGKNKTNENVSIFLQQFWNESGFIGLLLFLGGTVYALAKNFKMAAFWLAHFLMTLYWISVYNIHDIENYFILGYLSAALFICFGIYGLFQAIRSLEKNKKPALAALAFCLLPLVLNYSKANQSKFSYIDDYTKTALNSVDKNAIILSKEWDVFVGPAYYYHLVEHQRPDVTIIDKELLRRSWYHHQIKTWDRDLALRIEKEATAFNEEVIKFERQPKDQKELDYDPVVLQSRFEAYITMLLSQYKNRPVYVSPRVLDEDIAQKIDVKLPPNTVLIPETYFFRVSAFDTITYHPLPVPAEFNVEFTDIKNDRFQQQIFTFSKLSISSRIQYELGFNRRAEAKKLIELLQSFDPTVQMPEGL